MATEYGTRLKSARKHAGLTQVQASKASGIPQSTISTAEREGYGSADTPVFAKMYGVDSHWLATGEGEMLPAGGRVESSNVTPAPIGTRRVPLISYVQAGCWTEATDPATVGDGFEYLLTDLELSGSAFALQIEGESMLPQFRPGDRVIVDPEICPQPGDFVVAMNGGHEATFKKYRPRSVDEAGNVVFELIPLNEDFAPMRSDQTPIRIVGTMMEHRQYRRRA
jgi:SOS-response transcriptional repressor LexA